MKESKKSIFKFERQISYGRRILSFLFISLAAFILLYSYLYYPFSSSFREETYSLIAPILAAVLPFIAGVTIGTKKGLLIDKTNSLMSITKAVGTVIYSKQSQIYKSLDYVSVYGSTNSFHHCKLFYDDNIKNSVHLFEIKKEGEALREAAKISNALSLPLNNLIFEIFDENAVPYIEENEREISLIISEGERPFWQTFIAASFFTAASFCMYLLVLEGFKNQQASVANIQGLVQLLIYAIGFGILFSVVKDYSFDFKNSLFKVSYRIGFISYGRWKVMKKLNHVSVHTKRLGEFQLSMWYNTRNRLKLGIYGELSDAISAGKDLAKTLKTDLYLINHPEGKKLISYTELVEEEMLNSDLIF
ncbi:hypothetical protein [Ulvibacter antarcticus]|uniref:Uncharacterized protein n=1 Tax=Ulvibacter antarcticus TaxID=442714 RepID=A0A3L9YYX7_9FLAO|nr:hypothetical protein [Ulvibacter antarcticus]RMA65773.1 hypothetical protein BXY75_0186 [Ulvibacter antarcticus]